MSAQRIINLTFLICLALIVALFVFLFVSASPPSSLAAPTPAGFWRLTYDPGSALPPAWSPDQRLIAFESNRDGVSHLYLMNADGTHQRALTTGAMNDRHPTWSRDGKTIFFDSTDGIAQNIFSVTVADGARKQITHANGLADYAAPSPDGQQIAYYVYQDMTLNI